ncbi:MAG: hypothetical protein H7321_08845, partial [Bacteroidia bacterium]|nr:hypothetical protein [Bacteroidia bacterium]
MDIQKEIIEFRKNKTQAGVATFIICVFVFLLLLIKIYQPEQTVEIIEDPVIVDLNGGGGGGGSASNEIPVDIAPINSVPESNNQVTSSSDDAPVSAVRTPEVQTPKETKEQREDREALEAMTKNTKTGGGGSGPGNTPRPGNGPGSGPGTGPGSGPGSGPGINGGTGGFGHNFSRKVTPPTLNNQYNTKGKVVVDVLVNNRTGKVISANPGAAGSNTTSPELLALAKKYALSSTI